MILLQKIWPLASIGSPQKVQPYSGFIIPACAGETWGLYFSDYEDELRQLLEESTERWLANHYDVCWT